MSVSSMPGRCEKLMPEPANLGPQDSCGIPSAMSYDSYQSIDVLEETRVPQSGSFLAQFKQARLQYRFRAWEAAETETYKAVELASNFQEFTQARHQLSEIRHLRRKGNHKARSVPR